MDENKRLLIWLCIGALLVTWILAITSYATLPSRIPLHFGWKGQPDRWGDKSPFNYYMLPAVSTALVFLMIFLTKYPKLYNFPQKEIVSKWPEDKKKPVYNILIRMVLIIGLIMSIMFLLIQIMIIESAKSQQVAFSQFWPVMVLVGLLLILPIYYLVKISKTVKEIQRTIH